MIEALEAKVGRATAAGLLARAALSLGYIEESKGEQEIIIAQLIDETRNRLGISREDNAPDTLSRIADFLDAESDRLLSPTNTDLALGRLAERGDLPSDLYEISIIKNVSDIYGSKFPLEKSLIETTVRDFAQEQHYGPSGKPHDPAMISLFVRSFRTKWLLKNFVMLVAAKREGFKLHVHQAWRIYPPKVNIAEANTPVQLLQRFSDEYGAEIDINGRIGHFFVFSESVRKVRQVRQSFLSMRRIEARRRKASAFRVRFSKSLARRRQRLSQAKVRSTTHRRGKTAKPFA